MKTAISAPAPDEGSGIGQSNGGAPAPEAMMKEAIRQAQAGQAAGIRNPHYDQGLSYGTPGLRYAVGDETAPEQSPTLARVKLEMSTRTDANLAEWVAEHIALITGNTNFPAPQPLPADLLAALTDFQNRRTAQSEALTLAKTATTAKDMSRRALEDLMIGRGAYVQTTSTGNAALIEGVGFGVRNPRTPTGQLPPPTDVSAELNGTAGVVKIKWRPVARARGYIVECSLDVQPRVFTLLANTTKSAAEKQLTVGEVYVFRVAASGGSTGQSYWSAEVIRGAA